MSVALSVINEIINSKIEGKEISEILSDKSISSWKDLKKKYPKIYKKEMDLIFDMLHPY